MKKFFRVTFTVIAMLATMLVFAGITLRVALHSGDVVIPDLSNMSIQEASEAALKAGVDLNIENKFYSTTVPAGRVLSQAPAAGGKVRTGWQVRVTESLGPQQVTIPDVTGQTVRLATINIRRDSLDLGALAHLDAPGDADIVLAQTPPPDAGVDQPKVSLLLSTPGSGASSAFVMPSFQGMSYAQASKAAGAMGLRVASVGQTTSSVTSGTGGLPAGAHPGPNGTMLDASGEPIAMPVGQAAAVTTTVVSGPSGPVLSQVPEQGHRANKGDTVKLTFAHVAVAAAPVVTPATVAVPVAAVAKPVASAPTTPPAAKAPTPAAAKTPAAAH